MFAEFLGFGGIVASANTLNYSVATERSSNIFIMS